MVLGSKGKPPRVGIPVHPHMSLGKLVVVGKAYVVAVTVLVARGPLHTAMAVALLVVIGINSAFPVCAL